MYQDNTSISPADIYDEVAYIYDGSFEGLLSAIFLSYANHEDPSEVVAAQLFQPRLAQRIFEVTTDITLAKRVAQGVQKQCGRHAFRALLKASLAGDPTAGTAAYRFVRYAMDQQKHRTCNTCRKRSNCKASSGKGTCPRIRGKAFSDITHPHVEPLFKVARAVDQECEHIRQFARFEHLCEHGSEVWLARIEPRDSVVPLVMNHFVERFSIQPFILYDMTHDVAGIYDGAHWYLASLGAVDETLVEAAFSAEEAKMQEAWRTFYRTVAIDSRYNPELRRQFMPVRFWSHLTEMKEILPGLVKSADGKSKENNAIGFLESSQQPTN